MVVLVAGGAAVVVVAAAGGVAAAEPQVCTPPWPLHAPLREVPLKLVPSFQVAVTDVWASAEIERLAPSARVSRSAFMSSVSEVCAVA